MELRYHQATFDMLTQTSLDTAPYLQALEEYDAHSEVKNPLYVERSAWTGFDLYQREPQISETNITLLDTFEGKFGVTLPVSVREWYSLDISLLMMYANDACLPVNIQDFGRRYARYRDDGGIQLLDHHLLEFINEQQYGDWCIALNQGDDPPVFHLSENSDFKQHPPDIQLKEDSPSFSDFIYCYLWDWLVEYRSMYKVFIYRMGSPLMGLDAEYYVPLSSVKAQFQEIPQQCFSIHRFFSPTQRFRVSPNSDDPARVGDGSFYADSAEALVDLIRRIWGEHPPLHKMHSWQPEAKQVLESLKN